VGYLPEPIIEIWPKHYIVKIKNLAYLCHFLLLKSILQVKADFSGQKFAKKIHLKRSLEG
jgi:hypothetical protein